MQWPCQTGQAARRHGGASENLNYYEWLSGRAETARGKHHSRRQGNAEQGNRGAQEPRNRPGLEPAGLLAAQDRGFSD
jgi:hypothetical protein